MSEYRKLDDTILNLEIENAKTAARYFEEKDLQKAFEVFQQLKKEQTWRQSNRLWQE